MDGPCDAVRMDFETNMIVPNEFSVTRGTKATIADIDQCDAWAGSEKQRLLNELRIFDPYLDKYAGRASTGSSVGGAIGRGLGDGSIQVGDGVKVRGTAPSNKGSWKDEAAGNLKANAASAAGSFIGSMITQATVYDASKEPLVDLESDIDDTDTFMRLEYSCLREKGYQIDLHGTDGIAAPYLVPEELRVVLRRTDCMEVVMYQRPLPDEGLPAPAMATEECRPAPVTLAAVSSGSPVTAISGSGAVAATGWPRADLPEPLSGIDDRMALALYLEVEPACVQSRPGYQLCTWREIGKGEKSWKRLAKHTQTKRRVNVICELPKEGEFNTPDTCQIYPRETLGKPNLRDNAGEAALETLQGVSGIAAMSRLVGDGPVECEDTGDGGQDCRWFTNNAAQGFVVVGTAAKTKKPADVACRFSATGATDPESCTAFETR